MVIPRPIVGVVFLVAAARNAEWLGQQASITRLLLTNAVVIAAVLAISLNTALRAALPSRQ